MQAKSLIRMKKLNQMLGLLASFVLLANTQAFAQLSSASIDSLVLHAMQEFKVAGVSVAIVKDGSIIHEKGYGVKSVANKQPVDIHTAFQIASNSKAFTAAALAILVDEGKISWTDKVQKHIPEFQLYNEYVTANFTIEDLLCHRSGLGLGAGDLMEFPDGSNFSIKDVLTNLQYFQPQSGFRTKFDYDNQLYFVAGEVVARVSGMSWETFVQTRILQPLKMAHSSASYSTVKDRNNLAVPHSTRTGELMEIAPLTAFGDGINGAAGGMLSSARDMTQWMLTQLNNGKYGEKLEKTLFSEDRQHEMWSIHTVTEANPSPRYNSHFSGYGLGWNLSDIKGNMRVDHTGGMPGMLSLVVMIPDQKLGIVILTNTENGGAGVFSTVSQTIIDSYLGLKPMDWVARYSKFFQARTGEADSVVQQVWATVAQNKASAPDPKAFVGVYEDKWFGKVEVFMKDKQLWFKSYRSPKLNGAMQFYKANTFAIKWEYQDMDCDAFASFLLDEEGNAQSIKMKGISPAIDFSFDFQDLDLRRVK